MHNLDSPRRIINKTTSAFGDSLEILGNMQAWSLRSPLRTPVLRTGEKSLKLTSVVSCSCVLFRTQAARPPVRGQRRIINIGSVTGRLGHPRSSVYSATKTALETFSSDWAPELGSAGHTINVVAPALTETDMMTRVM